MQSRRLKARIISSLLLALIAMNTQAATQARVERFDPAIDAIVPRVWSLEQLAEGFIWSEGPVWIASGNYLLFTDVPGNTMYRWSPTEGLNVFLKPSGYAGTETGIFREPGANGLFPDREGWILMADHGNRQVARFEIATKQKTPLATHFEGKRFNSPNDVIRRSDGVVFFTDPPYGLEGLNDSKHKELPFNGVYRIDTDGSVHLLDRDMTFPNGLALSPDERTLYVANSDPRRPIWMAFSLNERGEVLDKRVFADSSDLKAPDAPGLPDGMRVTPDGTVFATAPGGVLIMDSSGKRLGRIRTGSAIANCAFGDDGRTLYLTSHTFLARIRLSIQGNR
ncbi:MAG TPA: SMP-30/gluconolactonase/LRE family protein [Povalibacter sp.]|uniref:SMP-30/gluconolactonase/LRE family protein n=1 Tax=Povalibacter sp. TaxID=1962978 RepID=UPI002CDAD0E5|nr:SMP-30/gluconolactonase/LRE family protein [Povalibacter sp.]HMN45121.1 SMP-30/gluconolactonase/LRE family protein [Povalibacter sp.]